MSPSMLPPIWPWGYGGILGSKWSRPKVLETSRDVIPEAAIFAFAAEGQNVVHCTGEFFSYLKKS